ncbi:HNH endonuclease signature motif containing protein [Blastococcus sp. URHD0036]|uniref:HNH endonuclease signature motif containing protein n=1 Tax=Blastococcus sp. URHD0036 TaxID=1380356 RepID=UPI00069214FA|nr:HNH endonuclease signature motif containing protein [Blastococcus sp. URHD0036]
MTSGQRYAVGVTLVPLSAPRESAEPDPYREPETLPELLPRGRSAAENARLLQQITAAEAMLAGLRVQAVMEIAAVRPDSADRRFVRSGADEAPGPGRLDGVSEFFVDELALVLSCSRTAASKLADQCAALAEKLPATWAALNAGRLDWPRARAIADELGWKARAVALTVIAEVEAAVLPAAPEWSITQLRAAVRRELAARDAAASDRRRADAERACDVTVRPVGDGISELVSRMPHELAVACARKVDADARAAKADGDDRLLGQLRTGALADRVLQPWDDRQPSVTASVTVDVPITALTAERFLAEGSPLPAVLTHPGAVAAPTGQVDGEPVTAAHVRRLLTDLDAIGLRAPAGGSLRFAFTAGDGALLAVATDAELRTAARRGCSAHPDAACGCPVLGIPAAVDRYRPSASQVRYLHTRDRTCRHPGCANRAGWSDCDHVVPHGEGGQTSCENLCCLCRRHHRLKTHAPGWRHTLAPDGTLTVTTPSGVTRTSRPPRAARAATAGTRWHGADPPDLPLTTPRVLVTRPDPPVEPDPADDPPPF